MKLLIVDINTEAQAFCAKRLESFGQNDLEMLDLQVNLVGDKDCYSRAESADVVVLGSGLGERATGIARHLMGAMPWLHLIMFVTDEAYGGGAFRAAHSVGVRKVFPDSASPLDFLQELVAIHADFRREGRTKEGKVIVVTHAKGGVGATSVTAALAEVASFYHRQTMLWDLDVETRDLSRSLTVSGAEAQIVSSWVNGSRELSRQSLTEALIAIHSDVSVLMPPDKLAESMDLVCHTDGMSIAQRVADLARVMFDVILVDTAGRMGPATGALLRLADYVVVVIDDTILGLTAVDLFLSYVKTLVGSTDRIRFLVNPYSGTSMGVAQIAAELEPAHKLGTDPWRLPEIPNDPKASLWPGSGRTLYSMGSRHTQTVFDQIAAELGIIDLALAEIQNKPQVGGTSNFTISGSGRWLMEHLFGKGKQKQDRESFGSGE